MQPNACISIRVDDKEDLRAQKALSTVLPTLADKEKPTPRHLRAPVCKEA